MRYALYARYSSDRQNERSIEDQLRICRERVAQLGGLTVATFTDAALSGASIANRPGLQALLAGARGGAFDVVLAEALDRLSRGQADTPRLFEILTHAGVAIVTLAEGAIDELHVGFKGTMNALFLKDLAAKIRRGQRGNVAAGRSTGGLAYGYKVDDSTRDAAGDRVAGLRAIDAEKAAVVRRIFTEYAGGKAPVAIAKALNRDGIKSPHGGAWSASAILGNAGRGNGILHTELYIGRLVYNRTTFRKDPETGKRGVRVNPREAWIVQAVPHLRIVEDALWRAAQAVLAGHRMHPGGPVRRRPKHLFAGLVVCGVCGGAYTKHDHDKLACGNHKDRGICGNGRIQRIAALEQRVLDGLRDRLVDPAIVGAAVQAYHAERLRLRQGRAKKQAAAGRRLREVKRQIARLIDAVAEGTADPEMKRRIMTLGRERDAIEAELTAPPDDTVIDLHPAYVGRYKRQIEALRQELAADEATRRPAAEIIRGLVRQIVLTPRADGPGLEIDLDAELEGLARVVRGEPPRQPIARPFRALGESLVAEERFQRFPQGLRLRL